MRSEVVLGRTIPIFTGEKTRKRLFHIYGPPNSWPSAQEIATDSAVPAYLTTRRLLFVDDYRDGLPIAIWEPVSWRPLRDANDRLSRLASLAFRELEDLSEEEADPMSAFYGFSHHVPRHPRFLLTPREYDEIEARTVPGWTWRSGIALLVDGETSRELATLRRDRLSEEGV